MADARKGQIIVTTVLIIAVLLLSVIVSLYETRLVYLKTRSVVVREVVGSITADFERALAHVLALATRAYFNYTRYEKMLSKYKEEGLTLENKHNFTIAREIGFKYLELWKTFIMESYSGYGVEVDYEATEKDLKVYLNRPRKIGEGQLMKGFWYYPFSASIINAKLRLNLTNVGFYGWVSEVTTGLFLKIHDDFNVSPTENWTEIVIGVLYDDGVPYPYLLTKGTVEVYVPVRERWTKTDIIDVTYLGNGNYSIKFRPYIEPIYDPVYNKEIVPVLVVIGDDRGILVEACSYDHITFKVKRSVPDNIQLSGYTINRPYNTVHEVYTLELAWDLNIYWLGMRLQKQADLQLPPIPFMPIKQLRVNVSIDNTINTLKKRPIQYEDWINTTWHGQNVLFPKSLSDPQEDYGPTTRLVFQVRFPNLDIDEQYVVIWWEDDLDVQPEVYPTQIEYLTESGYKDVRHPLYDIEFVDLEHPQSRNYANYEGVAAIVVRDPVNDATFGPYNLHAFDEYDGWKARYRPYGTWFVNYEYMRYSWIKAPIRIFAILNTTLVGDVYDDTFNYWDNYYDTLCIVQIVNGTRYIPVITFIYWKNTFKGYGYWLNLMMGRGFPKHFVYLHNDSTITYFSIADLEKAGTIEERNPGYMITHWNATMGRALVISDEAIELLKSIGGSNSRMASTYGGWTPYQGSIEYEFWSYRKEEKIYAGTLSKYWSVIFDYLPLGGEPGWLSLSNEKEGWKNAIIYAPMFVESYAPIIIKP